MFHFFWSEAPAVTAPKQLRPARIEAIAHIWTSIPEFLQRKTVQKQHKADSHQTH